MEMEMTVNFPDQPERLLSVRDVAQMTSLSVSHIRRESRAGKFPQPVTISESRVAWSESDVLNLIKSKLGEKK